MKYSIAYSDKVEQLTKIVQQGIDQGWKPQGGMAIGYDGGFIMFYQAMVHSMPDEDLPVNPKAR